MKLDYSKAALLLIDIQNDFCPAYTGKDGREYPKGAMAIKRADEIIDNINNIAAIFKQKRAKILATQDWHPSAHVSFASSHPGKMPGDVIYVPVSEDAVNAFHEKFPQINDPIPAAMQQVLWPDHCVQYTKGAAFHDRLNTSEIDFVFRKGYYKNIDSYSGFFENDRCTLTDLYGYLKENSITTLFITGLATDYCVLYSTVDSLRLGFKTFVVRDACKGINSPAGSIQKAIAIMEDRGALFVSTADLT